MSGRRKAGRPNMHGMSEAMMIAQHHAKLCLAIVIVDSCGQMLVEPAYNLGIERFARAADSAKLSLDRRRLLRASGDEKAIGCRRAGKIGDAVIADRRVGRIDAEI